MAPATICRGRSYVCMCFAYIHSYDNIFIYINYTRHLNLSTYIRTYLQSNIHMYILVYSSSDGEPGE
jgi:hypothetical protein